MYKIVYTEQVKKDLAKLKKNEPIAFKKVENLLNELLEHPTIGTGKPERLSNNRSGQWSRRISSKHRLIYMIDDEKIIVLLLLAYGHYDDK